MQLATNVGVVLRPSRSIAGRSAAAATLALVVLAASVAWMADTITSPAPDGPAVPAATAAAARNALGGLPLAWVANTGQSDPAVRFLAQGMGYSTFLTDTEAVVSLDGAVLRLGFEDADASPSLRAEEPLAATVSHFVGNDPSAWDTAAETSAQVRYAGLWPGIDATFRGTGSQLEWDLHLDAGADPALAGVTISGANRIEADGDHATVVVGSNDLPLEIPAVWQTLPDGSRVERDARWEVDGETLRVIPADWDPGLPGVIDPSLDWSTFLGGGTTPRIGTGSDVATAIAVDGDGNSYTFGRTRSGNFPTTAGAFDTTPDGADLFLTKLDPTGSTLVYSTILGGSGAAGGAIAVDETGSAFVVGTTSAGTYPTTPGAYDTTANGGTDAFVTRLSADGSALTYSTLLGGADSDAANGIALDASGNAHVAGSTSDATTDFPTTPGAYDTTHNGASDVFVTQLTADGSALTYSTLIGGTGGDGANGIALDASGNAHVTGVSASTLFPTTAGAYDTTHNGVSDAFVTKLTADGSALTYSTLIGGTGAEQAADVALDASGNAYITGYTFNSTTDYPTTPGAYDTTHNGATDAFVTQLTADGSTLTYSTLIGGSGDDGADGVALDSAGHVHIAGTTRDGATDYPTTPGAYDTAIGGTYDAFVTQLALDGSSLSFSTLLGGSDFDEGAGIAIDDNDDVFIAGSTWDAGTDYPTTPGAYDTTHNGGTYDVFVTKLTADGSTLTYSTLLGHNPYVEPDTSGSDNVMAIAADASGIYVTGVSASTLFPTTAGAVDTTANGGTDLFITKLDPTGSTLLYSTMLGGSGADRGSAISVDAAGHAFVTGTTASTDMPTTAGAYDTTPNGGTDAFVVKLDAAGGALTYSTLLGGVGADAANGIDLDETGNAFLTGTTASADMPTTAGAFDTSFNGSSDVFVTKLDAAGSGLVYSTFVGNGVGHAVTVDGTGAAYLTGEGSSSYPTTPGAYDTTPVLVGNNLFLTKLHPSGGSLGYSTFYGDEVARGSDVAVDSAGNAYVTGDAVNVDALNQLALALKFGPTGSALVYETVLGGGGNDFGRGVEVDPVGNAYLTGFTHEYGYDDEVAASPYPTTPGAFDTTHNGGYDVFATKLGPSGQIVYSTLLGGPGSDVGSGIVLTADGSVAIGGHTSSTAFPTTAGAHDTSLAAGTVGGFLTRLDLTVPAVGGCRNSTTAGAEIGMYAAQPGAQSGLRVSCVFDTATAVGTTPTSFTVHDFDIAQFHNGSARSVTNVGAVASGASTFTLASFAGTTGWVNRPITGPGIAPRTFVRSISGAGLVTLNTPTVAAIPAGQSFKIDNTNARSVADGVTTASSTTLTSATASFTSADNGLSVSGTTIPIGTTATFVNATTIALSNPATDTASSQVITIGATQVDTTTRVANDAFNSSTTVVRSTAARWRPSDIGLRVTGPGIPANTFILSVSGANATTTGGLAVNTAPQTIVIGEPSATAPLTGDVAAEQLIQLDLNPTLSSGNDPCSANTTEVMVVEARWRNPGSFLPGGLANTQPADTRAIGQLYFDTATADFSAFVVERSPLVAGEPIPGSHYDLVVPLFVPPLSMCASPTSPGLAFSLGVYGQTASQQQLPPGTGKPGTLQLRSIKTTPGTDGYLSTAFVTSNDPGVTLSPPDQFKRLCVYPAGPVGVGFTCGNG